VVGAIAYIVSVLLMIASPFFARARRRELSMVYVLNLYGYTTEQALAVTILYRVFEFWIPLAAVLLLLHGKAGKFLQDYFRLYLFLLWALLI